MTINELMEMIEEYRAKTDSDLVEETGRLVEELLTPDENLVDEHVHRFAIATALEVLEARAYERETAE